jgi:hypothetical protein
MQIKDEVQLPFLAYSHDSTEGCDGTSASCTASGEFGISASVSVRQHGPATQRAQFPKPLF